MRTCITYGAYRKHASRQHAEVFENANFLEDSAYNVFNHDVTFITTEVDTEALLDDPDVPGTSRASDTEHRQTSLASSSCHQRDFFNQFAMMQLKWKEGRRLPDSTLQDISTDVVLYMQDFFEHLLLESSEAKKKAASFLNHQLEQLLNKKQRENYWKLCLPFVKPEEIFIGRDSRGKKETYSYIPILKALEALITKHSIDWHQSEAATSRHYLKNVFDGSAFRNHAYFQGDTKKICIQLYTDEFEVCDPLGSRRGKQKMVAVYYTVLNMAAEKKSKLSSIHLAILVKEKLAIKHGLKKIFEPLVNDIAKLETVGITVNEEVHKGSVFCVTGDNLSQHRLGGFKCSFSHGRICRHCMALRHEISGKHRPSDFVERTPAVHNHHLSLVAQGLSCLPLYGVRGEPAVSFFGFEPTQHLPPDLMHDLHEGVIPFLLKHVISFFLKYHIIKLELLNTAIMTYPYGQNDKRNKPETLSASMFQKKGTLKGNASQIYCLFRYLPFYVGEHVPTGHNVWALYLSFRKIVDLIMSKQVTIEQIAYLERLISCFCVDFRILFPNTPAPCKLHYIIHYPKYMVMYGPLVHLWSMRYEAKHQYFKDLAVKLRNFKNITLTLSNRHQTSEMYLHSFEDSSVKMVTTGCKPVSLEQLPIEVQNYITANAMDTSNVFSLVSAEIQGTQYAVDSVQVTSMSDDGPCFATVRDIFSVRRQVIMYAQKLQTIKFDEHYHAYVVRRCPEVIVITDISGLYSNELSIHTLGNKTFISARHAFAENN
nr:uncharacterized protein LOC119164364 [Rhipicephalus microplus]